jgi:hypothetical protein
MSDVEQAIRERAYQLWLEGGCKHGQADMHWVTAQREILRASLSEIARVTVSDRPVVKSKNARKEAEKRRR